jgi:hypothetical protein
MRNKNTQDQQHENDIDILKEQAKDRIMPESIISKITQPFRHQNDHIYAVHINRSASCERDYYYTDIVKSEVLWSSGHRLCFKSIRDIRDFLSFYDQRMSMEFELLDTYYESDHYKKPANVKEELTNVMRLVTEERVRVDGYRDEEVVGLAKHENWRYKR